MHEPDWFVPVPGVEYLRNEFRPNRLREVAREVLPRLGGGRNQLVVLNGIWSAVPDRRKAIRTLASRGPVVMADAATTGPAELQTLAAAPGNLITISQGPEGGRGILVQIEAF